MKTMFGLGLSAAMLAAVPATAAPVIQTNFETPNVGAGFSYGPSNGDTFFDSISGVAGNGGGFGYSAPQGTQVGFIQGNATTFGVISLRLVGLTAGQSYLTSFLFASRPGYAVLPVSVAFNRQTLRSVTPGSTTFTSVKVPKFTATGGSNILTFSGRTGVSDLNAAIDSVSISAVPEPATWAMMIAGFGMIGAALRRRSTRGRLAAA